VFDNARDANQYLNNTVCYWNGQPIYIERVDGDFMASGYMLPLTGKTAQSRYDVRDPAFNCREYRLGYMNSERLGQAVFLSRRPVRGVSQGICDNNISFIGVNGRGREISVGNSIRDQGFVDMLMGRYPSRDEVLTKFEDVNVPSVALSSCVALKRHGVLTNLHFLEYKGREISFSETPEFRLPTEFEYLREICGPTGVLRAA
jgi:hypothetical protein